METCIAPLPAGATAQDAVLRCWPGKVTQGRWVEMSAKCTRILLRNSNYEEEEQPTHLTLFPSQSAEVSDRLGVPFDDDQQHQIGCVAHLTTHMPSCTPQAKLLLCTPQANRNGTHVQCRYQGASIEIKNKHWLPISAELAGQPRSNQSQCSELPTGTWPSLSAGSKKGHMIVQLPPQEMPDNETLDAAATTLLRMLVPECDVHGAPPKPATP